MKAIELLPEDEQPTLAAAALLSQTYSEELQES
jgi:hypothetical protein